MMCLNNIEEPRGKPQGIFDHKEFYLFLIRSLTPQQAAEDALAIAVQAFDFLLPSCPHKSLPRYGIGPGRASRALGPTISGLPPSRERHEY